MTVPVKELELRKEALGDKAPKSVRKTHQMKWNDLENSFGSVNVRFHSCLDSNTAVLLKLFQMRTKCGSFCKGLDLKHIMKKIIFDLTIYFRLTTA